ncbi:MAG: hypothetical protein WDM90_09850 [Ferruginibacter sp.]
MLKFDTIAASLLFTAFFIEFTLVLLHGPKKKMLHDTMANFILGICIILAGIFEKGLALSFFSLVYHFAIFTPHTCWWLWIVGFLSCDFIHYAYHWVGHKTRLFWAAHVKITAYSAPYFLVM